MTEESAKSVLLKLDEDILFLALMRALAKSSSTIGALDNEIWINSEEDGSDNQTVATFRDWEVQVNGVFDATAIVIKGDWLAARVAQLLADLINKERQNLQNQKRGSA